MDALLILVGKAVNALKGLLRRFANDDARNDFEQVLFDALRNTIAQYGRA